MADSKSSSCSPRLYVTFHLHQLAMEFFQQRRVLSIWKFTLFIQKRQNSSGSLYFFVSDLQEDEKQLYVLDEIEADLIIDEVDVLPTDFLFVVFLLFQFKDVLNKILL